MSKNYLHRCLILLFTIWIVSSANEAFSQNTLTGKVISAEDKRPVAGASISNMDSLASVITDKQGWFIIPASINDSIRITSIGFQPLTVQALKDSMVISLNRIDQEMEAVVVSGTLKAVKRSESPVAVEVYTPVFLKKNPVPSIFESLQNVNGVRPQLNCSVCNTGDIHINGLEGPYTMILIDGMPIVSSLGTVYGLFGIPTQLIERIEIVKGPASGLYGSEAIGGLINVITKSPARAPLFSANLMSTSWQEHSADLGVKLKLGKKVNSLLGVNYFNFDKRYDKNDDRFTDVTLQHRISIFNKLSFERKDNRVANIAARYFYEDRWGGETNWDKSFRGSDSIYGESIYTNRWELLGSYQLPVSEKIFLAASATSHEQNSFYGATKYLGAQRIAFGQLTWDKKLGQSHSLLTGLAIRYNYYDDNSTATIDTLTNNNRPDRNTIPGIFLQDEWKLTDKHLLLLGMRYDRHPVHGDIFTPRFAWKWNLKDRSIFRFNAGTGFRVVNLFTEDHAALTGARGVVITEALKPEQSYNVNLNYTKQFQFDGWFIGIDAATWYSYFTNQIIPDYDTDPNKIIYSNLNGHASSKGLTLNLEINEGRRLKMLLGSTLQNVEKVTKTPSGKKLSQRPVLSEQWSGTWAISYQFPAAGLTIDYTGNLYGPMRLPLVSSTDPRPGYSPVWSLQNIQVSKRISNEVEVFSGVKNLLNWTPTKGTPFIIARANDPFDKKVEYTPSGSIAATPENPYALSFDPNYVYGPNQGLRIFLGVRITVLGKHGNNDQN